ncbi:MAG: LAGLIDADG family homing endonuclease [Pseudonocardia sp.]
MITTDRGLTRLGEIGDIHGDRWQDLDLTVSTDQGPRQATRFFVNGEEPTRRIVTAGGYTIQGTLAHRVKVVDPATGDWVWKRLADVEAGDLVPMQLGVLVGQPRRVPMPVLDQAYYAGDRKLYVPDEMSDELAELVGYFMGEGSLHAKGIRLCVVDTDLDVVDRLRVLGKELFGIEASVTEQTGYQEVVLQSVRLARWWQAAGFAKTLPNELHTGKGWTPRVPAAVLESNNTEVYAAFCRGLFEADGTVLDGVPSVSTSSASFAAELRTILLSLGFATTTRETTSGWGGPQFQVRLRNLSYAMAFEGRVGFMSSRKAALLARERSHQSGNRDRVHLYLFEEVSANVDGGVQPTFDLSVPSNVTYVASGFVSHNTIGLMMDCDTTGIEPDLALVKFKKLVGGGSMQIVNQTVPRALSSLGYQDEQVEAIIEYVGEHGHVVDAPTLRTEHYSVFDCAMGDRSIAAMGHVRMMAAVQPFISGAISKCVVGDTLVTSADGLIRINSLYADEDPDSFRDEVLEVAGPGGPQKTDAFYYGGVRPVREIRLRSGHRVTGTPNHQVLVAAPGGPEWRPLAEVREGEYVAVQYGADMWSVVPARLDGFRPTPRYGCQRHVGIPAEMSEELAFLLGAYASEGHTTESNWTVRITNSVDSVLERVARAWRDLFGVEPVIERRADKCPQVVVASKTIVEFLRYLGCGDHASRKRIPDLVLRSPRGMVLAFLQGLALDAYVRVPVQPEQQVKWAICLDSSGLLDDLQAVMTNLGIVHARISKLNKQNSKHYDEVYASGEQARRMARLVPFLEPDKEASRQRLLAAPSIVQRTADVLPGITGRELYEGLSTAELRRRFHFLADARSAQVSRCTVEKLAVADGVELPAWVLDVLRDNQHFSPVRRVSDAGEREVYDISVPMTRAFVGNGVVNHNTVNMSESASVEDVEEIYLQGWKLGLKALAIYRDNCKVGQPLSNARSAKGVEKAAAAPVENRPIRRRLPKKRPSQTVSFTVGGAEGYLHAGSYPDDGLGEIFIKLGKQGSTLAGVMDAFSMSISVGLQYGIPLEFYVSKFSNQRFEPAGMTDDPDIRIATSVLDYLFRRLALDFLPYEKRAQLGIFSAEERTAQVVENYSGDSEVDLEALRTTVDASPAQPSPMASPAPVEVGSSTELAELRHGKIADAPLCLTCGTKMRPAGSCYVCEGCGSTSGCS